MITNLSKYFWPGIILVFLGATQPVHAKKIREYERERDEAQRRADSLIPEYNRWFDKVKEKEEIRDQKLKDKAGVVAGFRSDLNQKGKKRIAEEKDRLEALKILRSRVQNVNNAYMTEQRKMAETHSALLTRFMTYRNSESAQKQSLQSRLEAAMRSNTIAALLSPRREIYELYQEEIRTHAKIANSLVAFIDDFTLTYLDYEMGIRPFLQRMEAYEIPKLPPPEVSHQQTIARLKQMVAYTRSRAKYFRTVVERRYPEVEGQFRKIIDDQIKQDMAHHAALRLRGEILKAWLKTVNELGEKEMKVLGAKDANLSVGCGRKIRKLFDLYEEILSYKSRCENLLEDDSQTSPYEPGCLLFQPLKNSAEKFFVEGAWRRMNLTLFAGKRGLPEHLKELHSRLLALKVHREEGLDQPHLLLKAINYHDQLLEEWEKWTRRDEEQTP